jgi:chemotaxis signal transduction protein
MTGLGNRAAAMRAAFDLGFAQPRQTVERDGERLLALAVGGDPYALRMDEIASVAVDRRVTPLPGPVPELSGIVGLRGAILPVYDLARLLGYPAPGRARWLAVLSAAPVAVAFAAFEAYVVRPGGSIAFEPAGDGSRHVRVVARAADFVRPVISLVSVLDAIRQRAGAAGIEPRDEPRVEER